MLGPCRDIIEHVVEILSSPSATWPSQPFMLRLLAASLVEVMRTGSESLPCGMP